MTTNKKYLVWTNKMTGESYTEERVQISVHVWQSSLDNRYYTLGIIGWYDITDTIHLYDLNG